jgi:hypothetical protein
VAARSAAVRGAVHQMADECDRKDSQSIAANYLKVLDTLMLFLTADKFIEQRQK